MCVWITLLRLVLDTIQKVLYSDFFFKQKFKFTVKIQFSNLWSKHGLKRSKIRFCRPTFVRIWKKGAVEQYSPIPYLATLINCMLWTLYALPMVQPGSLLVLTINATGLVIEIVYIILFLTFSDKKMRLKVLLAVLVEIMFTALLALLTLTLVPTHSKRATIVGILCIFFSTVMYSSPLAILVSFLILCLCFFFFFLVKESGL